MIVLAKRNDIMVDIETLGLNDESTIFQVSAASFDITTGVIESEIDLKLNISSVDNLFVEGGTLKWWLKTDKDLLAKLISEGDKNELEMFKEFLDWVESLNENKDYGSPTLWGNGISFDNVKIKNKMNSLGLTYPISFKKERDVRTILDLASLKSNKSEREIQKEIQNDYEIAHNAIDDVRRQVRLVHHCFNLLNS